MVDKVLNEKDAESDEETKDSQSQKPVFKISIPIRDQMNMDLEDDNTD